MRSPRPNAPGPPTHKTTSKHFTAILLLALTAAGCSPKGAGSAAQQSTPAISATDLGKPEDYFKNLYGPPKSERRVATYEFSLPGYPKMIPLNRPLTVQQYQQDRMEITVLCTEESRRAIWVSYLRLDSWTDQQISAALAAYGSGWKAVQKNALNLLAPSAAPAAWVSSNGSLAQKTMGNKLLLYAPQLYADLRQQVQETERQKKAVPKF